MVEVETDTAAAAVVSGLDVTGELEITTFFSVELVLATVLVVVVVPDGTSGAAPEAKIPGLTIGGAGGVGTAAAPAGQAIVFGMLLNPGEIDPVVMNVLPRNIVHAPAPSALYAPGAPHIPPPPTLGPADNAAADTKDILDMLVGHCKYRRRKRKGPPYVGAGAPAGGPEGAHDPDAAAAAASGTAAFATPVTTASLAGMEERPGVKLGMEVDMTGQLPRPPALAGTEGHIMPALQGMQLSGLGGAPAAGQDVTYAVAVTTLESQGATAVTVICDNVST